MNCKDPTTHHTFLHDYYNKKSRVWNAISNDDNDQLITHVDNAIVQEVTQNPIICSNVQPRKLVSWFQFPVSVPLTPEFKDFINVNVGLD